MLLPGSGPAEIRTFCIASERSTVKPAFHDIDADTYILARIVARISACRSACHRNNFRKSRVERVGEETREEVGNNIRYLQQKLNRVSRFTCVGDGVGVVECRLYATQSTSGCVMLPEE